MRINLPYLILGACLTLFSSASPTLAFPNDFDGDGKSDLAVYRPSFGQWYIFPSSSTCPPNIPATGYGGCVHQWGLSTDRFLSGDFDGDGRADQTVVRPNTMIWYIRFSSSGGNAVVQLGLPPDTIDAVDVDNNGISEMMVYRPSTDTWYIRYYSPSTGSVQVLSYYMPTFPGWITDYPASAQYSPVDGVEPGIYFHFISQPDNADRLGWTWLLRTTGSFGGYTHVFGSTSVLPAIGNYGPSAGTLDDWVRWIPTNGEWRTVQNANGAPANPPGITATFWGAPGDIPVSGDYDGDGINDPTVWRETNGTWFIKPSTGICPSYSTPYGIGGCSKQWGLTGDKPIL